MSAEIRQADPDAQIILAPSSGGRFEVTRDGELVFSKHKLGRFPRDGEVTGG